MTEPKASSTRTWHIFAITTLGLFLELTLIRWVTTEVRIFAYLQNTILVVCFLGLGMGAFTCRKTIDVKPGLIRLTMLVVLLILPPTREIFRFVSKALSLVGGYLIWGNAETESLPIAIGTVGLGLSLTFLMMFLIFYTFVPLGRILGRLLADHPRPILAYSVDIAGSLTGTLLAIATGALQTPPVVWFALIAVLTLPFLATDRRQKITEMTLLTVIVVASVFASYEKDAIEVTWSPYQRLTLWPGEHFENRPGDLILTVNNTGYQAMIDLSSKRIQEDTTGRYRTELDGYSQYDLPMRMHDNPKHVLLVGGGSGNDAAGALRQGAENITVVEIDPAIIDMGRRHHPEDPYHNERVTVVNDDARGFFATSEGGYDVIVFGLLDSHTTLGMTNARLDHYVYTRESIKMAKGLLAPRGIAFLSFETQKPYIADRMAAVLKDVFGEEPLAFRIPTTAHGWGGAIFVAGNLEMVRRNIDVDQHLSLAISSYSQDNPLDLTYTTRVATDDWPYIYLTDPGIPPLFLLLAGLVLGLFFLGRRMTDAPKRLWAEDGTSWHFFFLGAAFLLLEVQNISKATIALGATWWVNGVIITGVLVMILLANLIAARFPRLPQTPVYVALLATCGALYFVDLSQFAPMPFASKALIIGGITTLPMLFSGIIFIRSFAISPNKDIAFGANLLGAMVGALLEPMTYLTGVRFLLLVVGLLYLASWLSLPAVWSKIRGVGASPGPHVVGVEQG